MGTLFESMQRSLEPETWLTFSPVHLSRLPRPCALALELGDLRRVCFISPGLRLVICPVEMVMRVGVGWGLEFIEKRPWKTLELLLILSPPCFRETLISWSRGGAFCLENS